MGVKTGTTNDGFDGLMTSWSTRYAMVSWVGNHTRRVNLNTTMESLTEPMTRPWMEYALSQLNTKPVNWTAPTGIKTLPAFVVRKHIHFGDVEPSPTNDLYPSWYVGGGKSGKNTSQTLDKVSNKLATSCTPAAAKEVVGNANVASWNVDIFNGGSPSVGSSSNGTSNNSGSTDDVHNCNDSPPTVTLTAPGNCNLSCTITATVTQGTHPLSDSKYPQFPGRLTFTLNGQTIHSASVGDSPSTVSFVYNPSSNGSGTLTATVTDSVLYSGSASAGMSFSSKQPLGSFSGSFSGGVTTFTWSGGSPSYIVYDGGNNTLCQSGGTSCTSGSAPPNTTAILKDSSGATLQTTVH